MAYSPPITRLSAQVRQGSSSPQVRKKMSFQDLYDKDVDADSVASGVARKAEAIRAIRIALGKANNRRKYLSKRDEEEFPKPVDAATINRMTTKRVGGGKRDGVIDGQVLKVLKAARKYRLKQQKLRKKTGGEEF